MIRRILLYGCLLGGLSIQAQPQLKMEHYGSEEGLFGKVAFNMMQDNRGFLWIGTTNGAYRFDGYTFTTFNREGDGSVGQLYEDKQGRIWLGFHLTVVCVDPRTDSSITYTFNPIPTEWERVKLITEDQNGNICISARSGLYKFDIHSGQFEPYKYDNDLPDDFSFSGSLQQRDPIGNIWFTSGTSGLLHFDLESEILTPYLHDPQSNNSLSSNQIRTFNVDRDGILWVLTKDGIINRFNPKNQRFTYYRLTKEDQAFLAGQDVRAIAKDKLENLWITTNNGLIRIHLPGRHLTRYRHDPNNVNSLRNDEIYSIFVDREDNVWISAFEFGLSRINLRESPFKVYQHTSSSASSISNNYVTAIEIASPNDVWVGTYGSGLNRFDPQNGLFTHYFYDPADPQSLSNNFVLSLLKDSKGNLWVGTGNGLNVLSPRSNRFIRYLPDPKNESGISGKQVWCLLEDSRERIWLGMRDGGLNRYDDHSGKFIHYLPEPDNPRSLRRSFVGQIFEDRQGILWISNLGSGLDRFDPNHPEQGFTHFYYDPENPNSIGSPDPLGIHEDKDGSLWIATFHSGLNLLDREKGLFRRFTEREGLANHFAQQIAEDDQGYLWITTINGLSRFDPKSETFINYDRSDGLPTNNFGFFASIIKHPQTGELYVGSQNGMIIFHPDSLRKNTYIPPIVITSLEYIRQGTDQPLAVKGISLKKEIHLSYLDDVINIQFSALSFSKTAKNQYHYQVEGLQDKWIDLGVQRQISFTDLNPGTYTLRVKGSNGDGIWNPDPVELILIISPPWWWNAWSQTVYIIALLALLFALYHWRTYSLRRQRQFLQTRVFEQTREIRAGQKRSDELLLNILPATVAQELKETGKAPPVFFEEVSILFADFKSYTNIVASIPGKQLVAELDEIFQNYDDIVVKEGLEKIQTVGDAYLAACGLPTLDPTHAKKCVAAGKRIIQYLHERNQTSSIKWQVRLGIHSGPVTAGVIGKKKYSYDIFGDTVNIAARLESTGEAGKINISAYTHHLIKNDFPCTYRGKINAKGKGELDMYFVD